jgi:hypothetical protein
LLLAGHAASNDGGMSFLPIAMSFLPVAVVAAMALAPACAGRIPDPLLRELSNDG